MVVACDEQVNGIDAERTELSENPGAASGVYERGLSAFANQDGVALADVEEAELELLGGEGEGEEDDECEAEEPLRQHIRVAMPHSEHYHESTCEVTAAGSPASNAAPRGAVPCRAHAYSVGTQLLRGVRRDT